MIALNLDEPNLCPMFNETSHAVYASSGKDCVFTMVEGRILYDHGIYGAHIAGRASTNDDEIILHEITIKASPHAGADGTVTVLDGKNILVCTGCVTRTVPSLPLNGTTVIGSREAMVLEKRPESMIIIGSGAIGTEFAYIYNSFGTRVTLIEALPRMLPNEDDDSCMTLERAFKKQGIKVMTGASVESVTETCDGQVRASVKNSKGQEEEITADVCLVAIGVKPVVPAAPGLDLELTEKGFIKVNDRYATSLPGV